LAEAERLFGVTLQRVEWPVSGITYRVPAGLEVSVCRADDMDRKWKAHTTRTVSYGKRVAGSSGAIVLLVERKWLVLTRERNVRDASLIRSHEEDGDV